MTAMDSNPDPSRSMEAVIETWRAQSLDAVLWVTLAVAFPAVFLATINWPAPFSPPMRVSGIVLYLCVAGIAGVRRADTQWRAWAFFFLVYVVAALQLYRAGMAGTGRIGLMSIPLYALLLAGVRSGWVALVLSVFLYSAFVGALAWGPLAEGLEVHENPTEPGYWILQGIMVLVCMLPLLLLLSRFRTLHVQAVVAERRTAAQIREEIVMRTAAYEALERADREHRRLEGEITRVSEEERRRLGSELHDGLCQQLTAALLQCVALENRPAVAGPAVGVSPPLSPSQPLQKHPPAAPPPASPLGALRQLLEDSIGTAYDVARGLCPFDLGADSLGPALERLAKLTWEATGVECEFQDEGDTSINDQQTALHLYRITQEAVVNAVKHARPRRIVVRLSGAPDRLLLQVEDDGCGMPAVPSQSAGMGMNIMAYRAGVLGGTLGVEAVPGGGTRIVCRVPRGPKGDRGQRRGDGPQTELRASSRLPEDDPHER